MLLLYKVRKALLKFFNVFILQVEGALDLNVDRLLWVMRWNHDGEAHEARWDLNLDVQMELDQGVGLVLARAVALLACSDLAFANFDIADKLVRPDFIDLLSCHFDLLLQSLPLILVDDLVFEKGLLHVFRFKQLD